jgi:two-component system chemotaxis response regulator CheB
MRPQTVYVAPPDHHVTLEDHRMCVQRGPRENRHRPAIDPLYRTTARTFGRNAIAVLLTGNLDDGSVGMLAIRTLGGYGIVQDPSEAEASSMPRSALQYAGADSVLPAREIAPKLIELIDSRVPAMKKSKHSSRKKNNPDRETRANEETSSAKEGNGKPSVFACPECHGVLWELKNGSLSHYRCRVGHSYTGASLKVELDQSSERALWVAMRTLEEKAAMTQRMIDGTNGPRDYVRRLKEQMESDRGNAQVIRKMIFASE